MEPTPGTSSRDLPDGSSGLEKKLCKLETKFMQQFNIKEPRMREIVKELLRIRGQIKRTQEKTDGIRAGGAVLLVGGLGILAAPFTGGASLAAVVGGASVLAGGVMVGGANVRKTTLETDSVKAVETMGKEFKRIVEPLKKTLEIIEETCGTLQVEAAEYQALNTQTNMEEFEGDLRYFSEEVLKQVSEKDIRIFFKDFLQQVIELKVQSVKAYDTVESWIQMIEKLLNLIVEVFRLTPTPEQDKQLRDSIIQLADKSQKVIDECKKMQKHLQEILKRLSELREQRARALRESELRQQRARDLRKSQLREQKSRDLLGSQLREQWARALLGSQLREQWARALLVASLVMLIVGVFYLCFQYRP